MSDADETTVDEVAVARSLRRLDEIAAAHPELTGSTDADNLEAWTDTLMTMPKKSKTADAGQQQLAFRLSDELVARLDKHAERLTAANPGLMFTRTDAVRHLLTTALDAAEGGRRGKP